MQSFRTEIENPIVEKDILELDRKIQLFKEILKRVKTWRNGHCFEDNVMGNDEHTFCEKCTHNQTFPKHGQINLYPKNKVHPKRKRRTR